ncbi:hypothetical protein RvY_16720-1 [Ramazzottius varieornatus]|uniref:Uncharacterized protein n=1 Tax=Ramazzottius varieornatus TaxID=947166 RepID=A0A1D1VZI8_RAMVA|nr:hypothetical protein RvY_16720-1 [Ramazzottius varieornatus]
MVNNFGISSSSSRKRPRSEIYPWINQLDFSNIPLLGKFDVYILNHAVGYTKQDDDVAYESYLRNWAFGDSQKDIIKHYLRLATNLSATTGYFLGDAYTLEIGSAFYSVFRSITWRLTAVADLYAIGYYKRCTPFALTKSPSVLTYLPIEVLYPLQSNSFYNFTDIATCRPNTVDADGKPAVKNP